MSDQTLTVGVVQAHTLPNKAETIAEVARIVKQATDSRNPPHLLLFPEAFLGGYPRECGFGATIGARSDLGRDQFADYHEQAVDLGGDNGGPGDGTWEALEKIAKDTGVFLVIGIVEKVGGTMYCGVMYVCPSNGVLGTRRKLMPTGSERLVWGQGSTETLKAIKAIINGVEITLAAAICWENYMPLLRYTLYSQHVSLYLAPTADARPTWLGTMQHIATEGRCFVLSANQCGRRKELASFIHGQNNAELDPEEIICRGGSCIVDPFGKVLAGPVWDEKKIVCVTIDMKQVLRGKMDLDVVGSYSRSDAFSFSVNGLDLTAPIETYVSSTRREVELNIDQTVEISI